MSLTKKQLEYHNSNIGTQIALFNTSVSIPLKEEKIRFISLHDFDQIMIFSAIVCHEEEL